jgi:nucleotide-binding universal stress UspA family protein
MARNFIVAVDDSADSVKAFDWALNHLYKDGDAMHIIHVIPRLHMAAMYGVAPVDFVPAPDSSNYEAVIQKAEQFILDRFVSRVPADSKLSPIVHIIKVGGPAGRMLS